MRLIKLLMLTLLLFSYVYAERWVHNAKLDAYEMFYDADSIQETKTGSTVTVKFVFSPAAAESMKTKSGQVPAASICRNLYTKDRGVKSLERVLVDKQGKVLEKVTPAMQPVPIMPGTPADKMWQKLYK